MRACAHVTATVVAQPSTIYFNGGATPGQLAFMGYDPTNQVRS